MTNHKLDGLDREEQDILNAFNRGELCSVDDVDEAMKVAREAAHNTFARTRRISLRVSERDYVLANTRALQEGIPCQTLLSSIIHKYLNGYLMDRGQA